MLGTADAEFTVPFAEKEALLKVLSCRPGVGQDVFHVRCVARCRLIFFRHVTFRLSWQLDTVAQQKAAPHASSPARNLPFCFLMFRCVRLHLSPTRNPYPAKECVLLVRSLPGRNKFETRITASVLKQDPIFYLCVCVCVCVCVSFCSVIEPRKFVCCVLS